MTGAEGRLPQWSTELSLWWRDLDSLGHVTASAYLAFYQEAMASFVVETWDDPDPMYVVAHLSIGYHHEIQHSDGPIRVYVGVKRLGTSSFDLTGVIEAAKGRRCSSSQIRFVAWDPDRRAARKLTELERKGLLARLD